MDLPTSPLAPTSMVKRWTPYPLASRSIARSKYWSLFKALLRSILSSHGTVNSTRMKESVAVDANTRSGRLPLSCSTLWQCLCLCRSAETSQSLALESKSLLCFSFFSLQCCAEPSPKKYILLAGAVSLAFALSGSLNHALLPKRAIDDIDGGKPNHFPGYIYVTLHYITLHYITLHYITLRYVTLHYITLHYIILYYMRICMRR